MVLDKGVRHGALGTPATRNSVTNAISVPLVGSWGGEVALVWCSLFADGPFYGMLTLMAIPPLHRRRQWKHHLNDGISFARKSDLNVFGVAFDETGGATPAIPAREQAAIIV